MEDLIQPSAPRSLVPLRQGTLPAEDFQEEVNGQGAGDDTRSVSLRQYLDSIRHYWWIVMALVVLGLLGGAASVVLSPVLYEARTTLEVQGVNESFMNMNQVDPNATNENDSASASNLQTQIQILDSSTLKADVIRAIRRSGYTMPAVPPTFVDNLRVRLKLQPSQPDVLIRQALQLAVSSARSSIVKGTRIIEIQNSSTNPTMAALALNTLTEHFVAERLKTRLESNERTAKWLAAQLADAAVRLSEAEAKLGTETHTTNARGSQATLDDQQLRQIEIDLSQIRGDKVSKQARYDTAVSASPEVLAVMVQDQALRERLDRVVALQHQLADLERTYTPTSAKVKVVQAQIAGAQEEVQKARKAALTVLELDLASIQRREQMLSDQYARHVSEAGANTSRAARDAVLEREVEIDRQTYSMLLGQLNQAGMARALPTNNIRVIDPAQPSRYPYKPTTGLNLIMGGSAGLVFGCLFVFVREHMNSTVREPGVSLNLLRVPELGVIPSAAFKNGSKHPGDGSGLLANGDARHEGLALWQQPSMLAESFRVALTSLVFTAPNRERPRVIVITSPGAGEGKTTIASNLAIAMSEVNRRVLLVGADLRGRRLHQFFDVPNTWGLVDLLEERMPIESYPREGLGRISQIPGLWVLPMGRLRDNPSNLLHSPRFQALIARLRNEFDCVLIDTPPALRFADARILGRYSDGVLLVLRSGQTDRAEALEARRLLDQDGTPVLGTILNDWRPRNRNSKRYATYHYSSHTAL